MSVSMRLDIKGMDQLVWALANVPEKTSRAIQRKALVPATKPMRKLMRSMTPRGVTGNLRKSFGWKKIAYGPWIIVAIIGYRIKMGKFSGSHGHFVELGTKERRNRKGASRGKMPALHQLERAFNVTASQSLRILMDEMWKRLSEEVRKVARRAA